MAETTDLQRLVVSFEASTVKFEKAVKKLTDQSEDAGEKIRKNLNKGFGAKNASLQNLSFQINDVVSGLAMGQAPMRILVQQGGQFFQIWQQNRNVGKDFLATLTKFITPTTLAVAGVAALGAGLLIAYEHAENLKKVFEHADLLGVDPAQLKKLQDAASGAGFSSSAFTKGSDALSQNLNDALHESTKLGQLFLDNNLRIKDQAGNAIGLSEALGDVATLIQNAGTSWDKVKIAEAAGFAADAVPYFEQWPKAIDLTNTAIDETSDAIKKKLIAKADDFTQAWKGAAHGFGTALGDAMLEAEAGLGGFIDDARKRMAALNAGDAGAKIGAHLFDGPPGDDHPNVTVHPGVGVSPGEIAANAGYLESFRSQPTDTSALYGQIKDVSQSIKSFVDHVVSSESHGDPTAKNPNSTATGVGQFIESTWLKVFKEAFPQQAAALSKSAILALRNNPDVSKTLIAQNAEDNAKYLQKFGEAVSEANLQLAHFLGPKGAVAVLEANTANPNTPAASVLSPQAVAANPSILGNGKTVADVLAYAQQRTTDTRQAAGDLNPDEKRLKSVQDIIKADNEDIATMGLKSAALTQTAYQVDYAAEKQKLLNEALKAGVALSPEVVAGLDAQAQKHAAAAQAADEHKKALAGVQDAEKFVAESGVDALSGLITGAETAKEALKQLADTLLDAALKGLLLGEGPFSGIFGTASPTKGGLGGILGALVSVFPHAAGGPFNANDTMLVGEKGPELVRFGRGGFVTPNHALPRAGSAGQSVSVSPTYNIDARGADSAAVARLRDALAATNASIEKRAVQAMAQANLRGKV